jgi:hypothetical protein
VKTRAEKTGRNISKVNYKKFLHIPVFKPAKFLEGVKNNVSTIFLTYNLNDYSKKER